MSGKRIVGMIGALMAVLGSGQALANTRTGISAYQRGDYATALREWEQGARAGDPQALYNLGVAYAEGKAVPRDQARAVTYYQQGASKGSVLAAYNLGQAYRKGEGVGVDHAQAAKWYRYAATRGHFRAANELGILYAEGKGVPRDPIEGFAWIYTATHVEIMDSQALNNAMQLARTFNSNQIKVAQTRGQTYYQRYMAPNRATVRALMAR